jgi:predicted NAD/FAD-dependent oxidoreductase
MPRPVDRAVAILGAGIAGASAARSLADLGYRVVVHDKGRVPGGRAATRSRGSVQFDHGAQYFTGREAAFLEQIGRWAIAGSIAEWRPRLVSIDADGRREPSSPERRWVGVPGMNRLAASLLDDIEVFCGSRVIGVERRQRLWYLQLADATVDGPYQALLCTVPAPQVLPLLGDLPLARQAHAVNFAPSWALMLEFAEPLETGFDAAFVNVGPLSWIARDSSKPGRPGGERWVVHAGPYFSRAHLEATPETMSHDLQEAFFAVAGVAHRSPLRHRVHRWRHALAQPPLHVGALADPRIRLAIGGDWCQGSRVEGAWLSGQALARHADGWLRAPR